LLFFELPGLILLWLYPLFLALALSLLLSPNHPNKAASDEQPVSGCPDGLFGFMGYVNNLSSPERCYGHFVPFCF
jgi:hypothetical protein